MTIKTQEARYRELIETGSGQDLGKLYIKRLIKILNYKATPISDVDLVRARLKLPKHEQIIYDGYNKLGDWLIDSVKMAREQLGCFRMGELAYMEITGAIFNNIIASPDDDALNAKLKSSEPLEHFHIYPYKTPKEEILIPLDRACAYLYGHNKLIEILSEIYKTPLAKLKVGSVDEINEFLELMGEMLSGYADMYYHNKKIHKYLKREYKVFTPFEHTAPPTEAKIKCVKRLLQVLYKNRFYSSNFLNLFTSQGTDACFLFWNEKQLEDLEETIKMIYE